ncbi:MAG: hypothetical protein NWE99_09825 [Candidatus Bathyarchaeota archaeon]|nr:hypothetical protein [Candidatus Bathyarchaeota archaeon]
MTLLEFCIRKHHPTTVKPLAQLQVTAGIAGARRQTNPPGAAVALKGSIRNN